jgi:hypothetical protein
MNKPLDAVKTDRASVEDIVAKVNSKFANDEETMVVSFASIVLSLASIAITAWAHYSMKRHDAMMARLRRM